MFKVIFELFHAFHEIRSVFLTIAPQNGRNGPVGNRFDAFSFFFCISGPRERHGWIWHAFFVRFALDDAPNGLTATHVCMYVRTYVCMYVCMYVRMYVCMYVCMHVCIYIQMYIYRYIYIYLSICIYIDVYIYIYTDIYIYIYIYIYNHIKYTPLPLISRLLCIP